MPSIEHDALSEMALAWLASRCGSFRGATEVQIAPQYVADAAALCVMYHKEFRRHCDVWGKQPKTIRYVIEPSDESVQSKVSGDIADYFACVFEAKTSRNDFCATFRARMRLPRSGHADRSIPRAHLHWCVIEPGVANDYELPDFWGLLQRRGRGLSIVRDATWCESGNSLALRLADRLLWKPARGTRLMLPCCPSCNGPLQLRKRVSFSADVPSHLMDADPEDAGDLWAIVTA